MAITSYKVGDINPSGAIKMADESMLAPGGTGVDTYANGLPNYAGATRQGFINLDPTTGLPKMLPATRSGPTNLGSLIGAPRGAVAGIPGLPSGGAGGAGMPIDVGAGGNPAAITGPGGANPTPGPNPSAGVDPSGQLPSYILNQFGQNLAGALRGELPADVQNMLQQQAAEYGVGSGTQGSQFQGYRGLRNLGLTSLDRMQQAENLVAGQFTKPADKLALDQSAQKIKDLEDQFNKSLGLEKEKLAQQLQLERDKFAAQQNQLKHENQLNDLQALGLKYGGGGAVGGGGGFTGGYGGGTYSGGNLLTPFFDWATGTTSYY